MSCEADSQNATPPGPAIAPGIEALDPRGRLAPILTAERTALNFLGHLSGVASLTATYVEAAASGGSAQVWDTRKTTPGMRVLTASGERFAVDGRIAGGAADVEVRAFVPTLGVQEDPVTGSLNAGLAQWLIGSGVMPARYVASQGTAMGRAGRVHVEQRDGDIWIGGDSVALVEGRVSL